MVRYSKVWYVMVWLGMSGYVWHGKVLYGRVWHGKVCYAMYGMKDTVRSVWQDRVW